MANLRPFSRPLRSSSSSDNSLEERLKTQLSLTFEPDEPGRDLHNKSQNFLPCLSFCLKDSCRSFEQHISSTHRISELSIKLESSLSERENKESMQTPYRMMALIYTKPQERTSAPSITIVKVRIFRYLFRYYFIDGSGNLNLPC